MKTVAEGVESIEQIDALKKIICDIFQEYYYSKPHAKKSWWHFYKKENNDRR